MEITWVHIALMVISTALSLLSGLALFTFQRNKTRQDKIKEAAEMHRKEIDDRLCAVERAVEKQLTEERFKEIIREELKGLELRLINEGRLAPMNQRTTKERT